MKKSTAGIMTDGSAQAAFDAVGVEQRLLGPDDQRMNGLAEASEPASNGSAKVFGSAGRAVALLGLCLKQNARKTLGTPMANLRFRELRGRADTRPPGERVLDSIQTTKG
jgi:hypothetical protein